MMIAKTVRSYLKVRLAEKAMREDRNISLRAASRESGVSLGTLIRFADNTLREIPVEALTNLCIYLGCQPGDLLRLEDVPEEA